jgi:hypothetical protein
MIRLHYNLICCVDPVIVPDTLFRDDEVLFSNKLTKYLRRFKLRYCKLKNNYSLGLFMCEVELVKHKFLTC